ncbi:MAG: DUF1587 domain-containing protein, partial [Verrucomicrobiota bacterium]
MARLFAVALFALAMAPPAQARAEAKAQVRAQPLAQAKIAAQAQAQAKESAALTHVIRPFLATHCYRCHNADRATSGLNLEALAGASAVQANRERWEVVARKLSAGEMPPKGVAPPSDADRARVVQVLQAAFDRADRDAVPDPGRVTARRLNRAEYNNTVHDLLGVDFRPADDFPQDDSGYGFDNNGDVLSLSVVQMEKYLGAAEAVARTAVYGPQATKPVTARYQPFGRRRPGDPDNLFFNTHPYLSVTSYDESGLSMPNSFHVTHRFPA